MAYDPTQQTRDRRFEALALPHLDAAYNLARWLARDEQDAADIVQDAMLRAFVALDGLRGEDARPWLLAIVRNSAYTWLRRNRPADLVVPYDEDLHDVGDASADPQQLALRAADRRRVDTALAALPVEFREAIVLRELEELSYREIATVLSVPVGTVMSRLSRGRLRLLRLLVDDAGAVSGAGTGAR